MEKGLVSIIIPTYNQGEYILECIESVFSQTYSSIEIIVVDDGSTDNTAEIVKMYGDRVKYILKNNGGPASARNAGIIESRGEFIAFLDSDDTWFPEKTAAQVDYFNNNPGTDIVFSIPFSGDTDSIKYCEVIRRKMSGSSLFDTLLRGNFIHTSTVIARKQSLFDAGLFDEDEKLISVEDYNLWLKLSRMAKFDFVKVNASRRREHKGSLTHNFERMFLADLYNFHKLKTTYPEWNLKENPNYKTGYGNYCYAFGDGYFYNRDYKKSRKYLRESLRCNMWNLKAIVRFICTFIPSSVMNKIRGDKRR